MSTEDYLKHFKSSPSQCASIPEWEHERRMYATVLRSKNAGEYTPQACTYIHKRVGVPMHKIRPDLYTSLDAELKASILEWARSAKRRDAPVINALIAHVDDGFAQVLRQECADVL